MSSSSSTASARALPSAAVQSVAAVLAVVGAVALPQIFHVAGAPFGVGTGLGEMLLPMHLPVLLVGLLAGPYAGLVAGALSPLVSAAMTGMPGAAMVPFMVIELASYGLFAGLLRGVELPKAIRAPWLVKVLIAQIAGRAVRAVAILVAVTVLGRTAIGVATIWTSIAVGLPGLVLQWLAIPAIMVAVERSRK